MSEDLFEAVEVPAFGDRRFVFAFEDENATPDDPDVRAAIETLLDPESTLLSDGAPHVLEYCRETLAFFRTAYPEEPPIMNLEEGADVWSHVQFGETFYVTRRERGDSEDGIYFSLECECEWEPEHGLQLVIRDGRTISKVGPYNGHVTNSGVHRDPTLAGVVYVSHNRQTRR